MIKNKHAMIQVAKFITILAETVSPLFVVTSKCFLMNKERRKHADGKADTTGTPGRGIHAVRTNVPFRMLVTHFSKTSVVLPKHICIALGTGPLKFMAEPDRNEGLKPTVEVNAVHYKELEECQTPIDCHMEAGDEHTEQKANDCRCEVKIDPKLDAFRVKFIGMTTEFESTWDGYQCSIWVAKPCID